MTIQLKTYQVKTLETLKAYLKAARFQGAAVAYDAIEKPGVVNIHPYRPLPDIEAVPFVCLRLPTGGGKTLLAAHTVRIAAETYLEQDYPLVLWLVPSNTIRRQTLETLETPGNPNYEVLHAAFEGKFMVLDIGDFNQIRPHDLDSRAVIVLGTMQTLRVENTEGRKVYAHNEDLEPHFSKVLANAEGLERCEDGERKGKIKFSFANLMHLHRPLVIVDEAQNFGTSLSSEVKTRVNAACVIEFTATPDDRRSNVLHRVSATELKVEEMIKLPIMLTEHPMWEAAVHDSIRTRQRLEDLAGKEEQYIRPIVLFQAENRNQDVTWQVLKDHLINGENIPETKIAVVTGDQRELYGINLFDPHCPIDFVITVQALKEGWDCSFAYVFCSVANVHSAKDVEQILGRVLRMPYARRRGNEDLNRAYAHVSSTSWPQSVKLLHDRLVHMGFEKEEADISLQACQPGLPLLDAGEFAYRQPDPVVLELGEKPDLTPLSEQDRASILIEKSGRAIIAKITGLVSAEAQAVLVAKVEPGKRDYAAIALQTHHAALELILAPVNKGEKFVIPQLCLRGLNGQLALPDGDIFLDAGQWALTGTVRLSDTEFSLHEDGKTFEIDIEDGHLHERFVSTAGQMNLDLVDTGWTESRLAQRLDKKLRQPDISQPDLLEFIQRTVAYLVAERHIPLPALVRGRFLLQKVLESKIRKLRAEARRRGYQVSLFSDKAPVEVSFEYKLSFGPYDYEPRWLYLGWPYRFTKHFYPQVGELKNSGEEFECAKLLDIHPKVKYWLRNIERSPRSFRFPTSTDYFYPDFVAMLTDGRIMIVEYKGALHDPMDVAEKESIGKLWEAKSGKKGLFLMAWDEHEGCNTAQQIDKTIG